MLYNIIYITIISLISQMVFAFFQKKSPSACGFGGLKLPQQFSYYIILGHI